MKNFNEYVHFVVGAKIAGQEIERRNKYYDLDKKPQWVLRPVNWNWGNYIYRIKLPDGWEYVIENGEIAFREPNECEYYLMYTCDGLLKPTDNMMFIVYMHPIIKRKDTK